MQQAAGPIASLLLPCSPLPRARRKRGGGGVWMESGTVDCFPEQQAGEAAPGPGRGAEKAAGEREGRGHT